jgi:hypothetical protein
LHGGALQPVWLVPLRLFLRADVSSPAFGLAPGVLVSQRQILRVDVSGPESGSLCGAFVSRYLFRFAVVVLPEFCPLPFVPVSQRLFLPDDGACHEPGSQCVFVPTALGLIHACARLGSSGPFLVEHYVVERTQPRAALAFAVYLSLFFVLHALQGETESDLAIVAILAIAETEGDANETEAVGSATG